MMQQPVMARQPLACHNWLLQNTYVGANFFLGSNKTNGRVQVNYVIVGGDDIDSTTPYNGVATGFSDNALLTQYQMSF